VYLNMNLFKRGMIFVTFLGSCLGIALSVAALGTKFWIVARARRISNPEESNGRIHFGLFDGKKELNVAYGWRTYDVSGELDSPYVKISATKTSHWQIKAEGRHSGGTEDNHKLRPLCIRFNIFHARTWPPFCRAYRAFVKPADPFPKSPPLGPVPSHILTMCV
jgi:hypothetical protein